MAEMKYNRKEEERIYDRNDFAHKPAVWSIEKRTDEFAL